MLKMIVIMMSVLWAFQAMSNPTKPVVPGDRAGNGAPESTGQAILLCANEKKDVEFYLVDMAEKYGIGYIIFNQNRDNEIRQSCQQSSKSKYRWSCSQRELNNFSVEIYESSNKIMARVDLTEGDQVESEKLTCQAFY